MRTGGPDLSRMVRGPRKGREESKGRWEKGGGKEECSGGRNREDGKMGESSYLNMGTPNVCNEKHILGTVVRVS